MPDQKPKLVAGIATVWYKNSHASLILGKMLDGNHGDGKDLVNLKLPSLYVDQFPKNDQSRERAEKFNVRMCKSIAEAVTLGTGKLAVDGVVIVGEHGTYPINEREQTLYPRRKFFDEVAAVFETSKRSVPVFSDKHLSASWDDAKSVYDKARALYVPFLAGSSVPLTWRNPELKLPLNCEITTALALGYGGFEAYGFHALEALQCMVERRKGGETGVKAVQTIMGPAMYEAMDAGKFSKELLEEAIARVPVKMKGDYRTLSLRSKGTGVILIEYRDGFKAAIPLLNSYVSDAQGGAFTFACRLKGESAMRSTQFYLEEPEPYSHFWFQLKAIDSMIQTGHAPYPVERTLLTTGILDAAVTSRHEGGKRIETPHLAIKYTPTDWPFAVGPLPKIGK